jgi:hypothetical protein
MSRRPRLIRRLKTVPALRWLLWVLLFLVVMLLVAGLPEWAYQRVVDGRLPRVILLLPALLFGAFVVVFGIYRFMLAKAGKYNAGKAFVQVGLAVLVLTLLLPPNLARYRAVGPEAHVALLPLLSSSDPKVRAAACEALAARRGADPAKEEARRLAAEDPDPRVRAACRRVR